VKRRPRTSAANFVITIKVRSKDGSRPYVDTLGGDTIFCKLAEGQTASWKVTRLRPPAK
jgi:hypothetical protein